MRLRIVKILEIIFLGLVLNLVNLSFVSAVELKLNGYTLKSVEVDCSGGLDFLPNGDIVGFDGTQLILFDANDDNIPAAPEILYTLGYTSFGSFVKVSPSGEFVLFGETSQNKIYKYSFSTQEAMEMMTLANNYDLAFIDEQSAILSACPVFAPTEKNKIYYWNFADNELRIIAQIPGPSGAIALDDARNLYYIKSTFDFPAPPGSHKLLKFSNTDLERLISHKEKPVLQETDAQLIAHLDSGFNLALNSFGDIFVSDFNGVIHKISPLNGRAEHFADVGNGFAMLTVMGFYKTNEFFSPFKESKSKLAFVYDDFSTRKVYIISPQKSDPFADEVLFFEPGEGISDNSFLAPFTDPANALGAPLGGGVFMPYYDPENPAILTLGSGGSLGLRFNGGLFDDAENLQGLDLITFGNSFFINGNPFSRSTEPGFVEVSKDTNHNGIADDPWFLILPNILPADLALPYSELALRNYVDYNPTMKLGDMNGDDDVDNPEITAAMFYTYPTRQTYANDSDSFHIDVNSGGGDAMDLRDAVAQEIPGMPVLDSRGNPRRVFLDRIDFVRISDALLSDGNITTEVDSVSDARRQILGNIQYVDNVRDIQPAIDQSESADTIVIKPGLYKIEGPIFVKPGITIRGSGSGLWTPNIEEDDTIIDGSSIKGAAFILKEGQTSRQGYAIAGLYFKNCQTALRLNGTSPVIEENFFQDCRTAIYIPDTYDAESPSIVIRKNIFGHKSKFNVAYTGVYCLNGNLAILQNTFLNYSNAAVLAGGVSGEIYLRDNIFVNNTIGIMQEGNAYISGCYNGFCQNRHNYSIISGDLTNNILKKAGFASVSNGDYRLRIDSPMRMQGAGGADPGVYDGPEFYPFNIKTIVKVGDINEDGVVDSRDLFLVARDFGKVGQLKTDLNHDGKVDRGDLFLIIKNFNK